MFWSKATKLASTGNRSMAPRPLSTSLLNIPQDSKRLELMKGHRPAIYAMNSQHNSQQRKISINKIPSIRHINLLWIFSQNIDSLGHGLSRGLLSITQNSMW